MHLKIYILQNGGHFVSVALDCIYRQVSNISCTLVSNEIVDHSDVVGAATTGAAPTTYSFTT